MFPTDHVWYLPNNMDMITCPKNGMTSFKTFYYAAYRKLEKRHMSAEHRAFRPTKGGPIHLRDKRVWDMSSFREYPFREGSARFAVKRDPVRRFVSAVEYLQERGPLTQKRCERDYTHYKKVSDLLDDMEDNKIFEIHLMPQTHFMRERCKYDHIYDIVDMVHMFREMSRRLGIPWSSSMNPRLNTMKRPESKRITNDLSPTDIVRIKSLYRIDYENGWC